MQEFLKQKRFFPWYPLGVTWRKNDSLRFGKLGHYVFWNACLHIMLYKVTWNNIKQVLHVFTRVGWVSKLFGTCWIQFSQNNLQKDFGFTFNFFFKIMHWSKISIFWKIGSFFTMLILINLITIIYHLRFSQTGYY